MQIYPHCVTVLHRIDYSGDNSQDQKEDINHDNEFSSVVFLWLHELDFIRNLKQQKNQFFDHFQIKKPA